MKYIFLCSLLLTWLFYGWICLPESHINVAKLQVHLLEILVLTRHNLKDTETEELIFHEVSTAEVSWNQINVELDTLDGFKLEIGVELGTVLKIFKKWLEHVILVDWKGFNDAKKINIMLNTVISRTLVTLNYKQSD